MRRIRENIILCLPRTVMWMFSTSRCFCQLDDKQKNESSFLLWVYLFVCCFFFSIIFFFFKHSKKSKVFPLSNWTQSHTHRTPVLLFFPLIPPVNTLLPRHVIAQLCCASTRPLKTDHTVVVSVWLTPAPPALRPGSCQQVDACF